MLPFIKKQKQSQGVSVVYRSPDDPEKASREDEGLEMAAQELVDAVSSGDKKAAARALRAAFEILDSEPHVEGPHIEE